MSRLLIVDGHNLLFQMFFGLPDRIVDKNGNAIQGVVGFVGALRKLITLIKPTHIVVLFDSEKSSARNELYADYKGNRVDYSAVEESGNPFSQLSIVYQALDVLGIQHCEVDGYETDDVIATYALTYGKENQVYISSFDSDYFQLISDRVKVVRYHGKASQVCDEQFIVNKFGVTPSQYALFKSLVGDASDNIKGVVGVGIKTAAKLVNEFYSLDNLIDNVASISNDLLRTKMRDNIHVVKRNYSLINLSADAPLPFSLEQLDCSAINQFTASEVLVKLQLK